MKLQKQNVFSNYTCGMRIFSLTPAISSIFFCTSLICFDSNLLYLYRLHTLLNICSFRWHYAFNNNEWMSNPLNDSTIFVVTLFRIEWRRWTFSIRSWKSFESICLTLVRTTILHLNWIEFELVLVFRFLLLIILRIEWWW